LQRHSRAMVSNETFGVMSIIEAPAGFRVQGLGIRLLSRDSGWCLPA